MNFLASNRTVVAIAAAVVVLLAVMTVLDLRNQTYDGFSTDVNNKVTQVRSDSPAEKAGFEVGDRILMSDGIAMTDSKALSRRQRAGIGDTHEYVIERDGSEQTLSLTYAGLPGRQLMLRLVDWLTGLCFLVFGLWPYFKVRNRITVLLAVVSLCFALLFIGPPYAASYAIRTVLSVLFLPVVILGFSALLHFLLAFPEPKPWLGKKNALRILYGPALLISVYLLFRVLVQPDATSVLNTVNNILLGIFFLTYFGFSMVVMVRTYLKATAEERKAYGLNVMAAGVVLALLFPMIVIGVNVVAPSVVVPGSDFFGLSFILLPLSFAYAAMKARPLIEDMSERNVLDEQVA